MTRINIDNKEDYDDLKHMARVQWSLAEKCLAPEGQTYHRSQAMRFEKMASDLMEKETHD